MATFNINGVSLVGNNIQIANGKIIIDGKIIDTGEAKNISVSVQGDVNSIQADACNQIGVIGNVKMVKTTSGDVDITGNVDGNVNTVSGDVSCNKVNGTTNTISGDILGF